MSIIGIVKDSLRYPLSDWKKILILGIFFIFSSMAGAKDMVSLLGITNFTLIWFIFLIVPIIGFLTYGYLFRIIKLSLIGVTELPEFNAWFTMFKDGFKIFIISFIYVSPAILILVISALSSPSTLMQIKSNPLELIFILFNQTGIWGPITLIYIFIIIPIALIAITQMANNYSKLRVAFRFREIFNKIGTIGWINLIRWYLVMGIIYLILNFIGLLITGIFSSINHIVDLIMELLLIPYIVMFLFRSLALFYISK